MDYSDYKIEDFVADKSFQRFVRNVDPEAVSFWLSWCVQHPDKKASVESAKKIIVSLNLFEEEVPESKIEAEWKKVQSKINRGASTAKVVPLFPQWLKVAASVALLFTLSGLIYLLVFDKKDRIIAFNTGFGEIKYITLPDSSQVILNGNSSLSYQNKEKEFELCLDGEAMFSIQHKVNKKLIVHSSYFNVEVTGTKFNVLARKDINRIVLIEGKVAIVPSYEKAERLTLLPGEQLEFSMNGASHLKTNVNPDFCTAWMNNKLSFNNASLKEITTLIEDTYGIKIHLPDSLLNERFTGSFPADNIEILIKSICKSFNRSAQKKGNQYYIR